MNALSPALAVADPNIAVVLWKLKHEHASNIRDDYNDDPGVVDGLLPQVDVRVAHLVQVASWT